MRKFFLMLAVILLGVAPLSAQSRVRPRAPLAERHQVIRRAAERRAVTRRAAVRRQAIIAQRRRAALRRARRRGRSA